jgi:hypothetical protein
MRILQGCGREERWNMRFRTIVRDYILLADLDNAPSKTMGENKEMPHLRHEVAKFGRIAIVSFFPTQVILTRDNVEPEKRTIPRWR